MRISDWSSDVCSSDLVSLLHPGVAQGHGAVEDRRAGDMVEAVGDEIAGAPELESRFRRRLHSRGLHVTLHHRACIRVDVVAVGLALAFVVRPCDGAPADPKSTVEGKE